MAQLKAAAETAVDTYGAIDVIVNNAGVMPLAFFADHERAWEKWHKAIDINIKGVINGISAVYDTMIEQGRGHVVNISSIYGNAGTEGSGVYSATKAAVDALSESLRVEAQGKIKVTNVKPTGVLGTNLASWVVNEAAVIGIVGQKAAQFLENVANLTNGALSPEQTDIDSMQYWLITPDDLANAVVHVIDQPWGSTSVTSRCGPAARTTSTEPASVNYGRMTVRDTGSAIAWRLCRPRCSAASSASRVSRGR